MGAGKSTLAFPLSIKLNLPLFSSDELRWYYLAKAGFCKKTAQILWDSGGSYEIEKYLKNYDTIALQQMMNEFSDGVMDLGARFIYYQTKEHKDSIERSIKNQRKIFCILPSQNKSVCRDILAERVSKRSSNKGARIIEAQLATNEQLLSFYEDTKLPLVRVYTEGKSIDQIIHEIEVKIHVH